MKIPSLATCLDFVKKRRWRLLVYVALLTIAFILERNGDHAGGNGGSMSDAARTTYQRVSTLGYRKTKDRYTRLILLDDNPDSGHDPRSVAHNACTRRLYLAKLVQALDVQSASVIVLDFRFEADCHAEDRVLADAISRTAQHVPVVLGQNSETVSAVRRQRPATYIGSGIHDGDLVPQTPSLSGTVGAAAYGLTMLAADTRLVPLQWTIATSGSDASRITERRLQDGLAFAAATAHERSLRDEPKLNWYMKRGEFPMTSFVPEGKFPQQTGLDLLCKDEDRLKWEDCTPKHDPESTFKGHVALIGYGDNAGGDMHDSVLGSVPGVVLQANYIESLVSG